MAESQDFDIVNNVNYCHSRSGMLTAYHGTYRGIQPNTAVYHGTEPSPNKQRHSVEREHTFSRPNLGKIKYNYDANTLEVVE